MKKEDIEVGMVVEVGFPKGGDMHEGRFIGTVVKLKRDYLQVKDQDDDHFDVDYDNVEEY